MSTAPAAPLQAPPPETSIRRATGWLATYARLSTTVGSKDTRDLRWWSSALSRLLGVPLSPNQVRQAMGADARISVTLEGATNVKGRQTLVAAGRLTKKGDAGAGAL
jgi:hypothetical protein